MCHLHVLPLSVTAAAMMSPVAGGRRHVVIVGISDPIRSSYFKSTSSYFKSTSSLPKYFQSTSEIFEVLWKYAVRTYVIIAKIMLVMCFAARGVTGGVNPLSRQFLLKGVLHEDDFAHNRVFLLFVLSPVTTR